MEKEIWEHVPCAATFSKSPSFFGVDFPLKYITDAKSSYVKGNNGNWYLDWISGLGANLLGYDDRYANDGFYAYVNSMTRHGIAFSMPHELEYTVADKLVKLLRLHLPHWRSTELQVRWTLSGSDACNTAIRLAKAVKGHGVIYSSGYHGWSDQFIAATPPAHGLYDIPGVYNFEFGTLPDTQADIAAVIVEIPAHAPGASAYMKELRHFCTQSNALLIVDEVVTGLRYARAGACETLNIAPDIVCMGKALGNGMPIAATIASADLMTWFSRNDPVFVSSTNVGNTGSLAAANFVLDFVANGNYLTHIKTLGNQLKNGLQDAGLNIIGNYARNLILWESDAHKAFMINYFAKNNILINRPNFVNMAHKASNVTDTIEVAQNAVYEWQNLAESEKAVWEQRAPKVLFRNR